MPPTPPPNPPPPPNTASAPAGVAAYFTPPASSAGSHYSRSAASVSEVFSDRSSSEDKSLKLRKLKAEVEALERSNERFQFGGDAPHILDEDGAAVPLKNKKLRGETAVLPKKTGDKGTQVVVININYQLEQRQEMALKEKFPFVRWRQSPYGQHSHPLAHCETMLAGRSIQRDQLPGQLWLDIYGNPRANAAFNKDQANKSGKRIDTLVWKHTEADCLRAQFKWGPEFEGGTRMWVEVLLEELLEDDEVDEEFGEPAGHHFLKQYDGFYLVHTLYYMRPDLIARLVSLTKKPVVAVVHRHEHEEGFLFDREIHYKVNHGGMVVQTDVSTNQSYVHAHVGWLWDNRTKVYRSEEKIGDAMVWDLQKFTNETWIVKFVYAPPFMDERAQSRSKSIGWKMAMRELNDHAKSAPISLPPPVVVKTGKVRRVNGVCLLALPGEERELTISNPDFFNMLKSQVVGKPRDSNTLKALFGVARRETEKSSLFPNPDKYRVESEHISDHVVGAFLADVDKEVGNLRSVAAVSSVLREQRILTSGATTALAPSSYSGVSAVARATASVSRILGSTNRFKALAETLDEDV